MPSSNLKTPNIRKTKGPSNHKHTHSPPGDQTDPVSPPPPFQFDCPLSYPPSIQPLNPLTNHCATGWLFSLRQQMLCLLSPSPGPNQLSAGERRGPERSRNVNFFFFPFSDEHVQAFRCIGVKAWEGEEFTETRLGFWLRCLMLCQKENAAHRQEVTHRPHLQQLHPVVLRRRISS